MSARNSNHPSTGSVIKSECLGLEKLKYKKNNFNIKKKNLMSTWENLDDSLSNEDSEEEANLCLMADASKSKVEPTLDASSDDEDSRPSDTVNFDGEEVMFESREDLINGYNQLLSTSACVSSVSWQYTYISINSWQ